MNNMNKLFTIATLVLSIQNIPTLAQSPNTDLEKINLSSQRIDLYNKFVDTVSKMNTYSFTVYENERSIMNAEQLKKFEKDMRHTIQLPFLFIAEKAKTFILTERSILDFETLLKNIAHNTLQKFIAETDSDIALALSEGNNALIQFCYHSKISSKDEFLLIFLSLLDHEINKAINSKNSLYIDRLIINELLMHVRGVCLALYLYDAALPNPKHPINHISNKKSS